MSKEKQIEKMAHDICESRKANFADGCRVCNYHENRCLYQDIACALFKLGYRKQSEGEWLGDADGYADGEFVYDVWHCSECNHCIDDGTDDADLLPNYCPNCGARMKGGAE